MPYMVRHTVNVLTDTGGDYTGYTSRPVNGYLHAIQYVKSTSVALSTLGDLTITGEVSGRTLLGMTAIGNSFTKYPRTKNTHKSTDGTAGSTGYTEKLALVDERIKVVVATTVNTANKAGIIYLDIEGGA